MLGFEDEVWFSRLAQPHLHAWTGSGTGDKPLRLEAKEVEKDDPDPKALACVKRRIEVTHYTALRFDPPS